MLGLVPRGTVAVAAARMEMATNSSAASAPTVGPVTMMSLTPSHDDDDDDDDDKVLRRVAVLILLCQ